MSVNASGYEIQFTYILLFLYFEPSKLKLKRAFYKHLLAQWAQSFTSSQKTCFAICKCLKMEHFLEEIALLTQKRRFAFVTLLTQGNIPMY